jgi:simple sugar transport system ATP-binding protein
VRAGEILGIAGVEGNGQFELEEGLFGLRSASAGRVRVHGREIEPTTTARRAAGIAYIPSDRLRRGLVPPFTVAWNAILGSQRSAPFARRGVLQDGAISEHADRLIRDYQVRAPGREAPAAGLSGGNQQKLVVARELARDPAVVLACQPTRGLDVGAIEYIHNRLLEMRRDGKAVLLISAELDEVRALADRILVMYEGRIVAERSADADEHELGLLMAGHEVVPHDGGG